MRVFNFQYERSATSVRLGYADFDGGNTTAFQVQYAIRRDFQFCIAPIFATPVNAPIIEGLSRDTTYWWRAREVRSNGSVGRWSDPTSIATLPGNEPPEDYSIQVRSAVMVPPTRPNRIVCPSAVAGYPATNMLNSSPIAALWCVPDSNNVSLCSILIELGGEQWDTIALLDTNMPEGSGIRVMAGNSDSVYGGIGLELDQSQPFRVSAGLTGRRGFHGVVTTGLNAFRFIRLELYGVHPPASLWYITHLVIGRSRTAKGYADMTDQVVDYSTLDRLRDGTPDAVAGFRARRVDFSLAFMEERMHERLFADLGQRVGLSDPMLIIPNSKPGRYLHDRLLYGNLTLSRQTNANARFTRSLSVDSIINP